MLSFIRTTSSAGSGTFIFGQTRAVRYVRGSAIALQSIKEGGLIDVILHGTNEHKNGTHSKLLDKGKYVYEFLGKSKHIMAWHVHRLILRACI